MPLATHDTRIRFALGPRRLAARFQSQTFAKEAGIEYCQRFTSWRPVGIVSGRARNWVCRIMFPGDSDRNPVYLRAITETTGLNEVYTPEAEPPCTP